MIKLTAIPVYVFVPKSIKLKCISSDLTRKTYLLIYNLAVGYILSIVFYLIVNVIPEKIKVSKAKQLIKKQMNQLLESMEKIISIILKLYDIDIKLKDIALKDLLTLDSNIIYKNIEIAYLTETYYNNGKRKVGVKSYSNFSEYIKNNITVILDTIKYMRDFEYFYNSEIDVIELIRTIEKCKFISCYNKKTLNDNQCFKLADTSTSFYEFIILYLKLRKLKYHSEYTISSLIEKDEAKQYINKVKSGELLNNAGNFWQEVNKAYKLTNAVIVYYDDYNTDILIKQLKKRVGGNYIEVNSIKKQYLENSKLAIFVIKRKTIKQFKNIISNIENQIEAIVISENYIGKKNYNFMKNNPKIKVIQYLSYKSSFKICNVLLNKEHPTEEEMKHIVNSIYNYILKVNHIKFKE